MRLIYIYHSGFIVEGDGFAVIIDYYKDSGENGKEGVVQEYLKEWKGKLYVLASHAHADHFNPEILEWRCRRPGIRYILSEDIRKGRMQEEEDIVWLDRGNGWQDGRLRVRAFGSTDAGISFLIEGGGKRIFHAGDLNNWHWKEESTPQEVRQSEAEFLKAVGELARSTDRLDLVMFPVDPRLGEDYMRGAGQFIDRIPVTYFVPMHFWGKYGAAAAFRKCAESRGVKFILPEYPGMCAEF